MSGIDKIIQQIEEDTKSYCDETVENARKKADLTLGAAQEEADRIKASFEEKTRRKLLDIASRERSSAALEEKKVILDMKQNVISLMLSNALQYAKELPDDEYFSLILKMIEKNSQPKSGTIFFSEKDLRRLPADFESRLKALGKGELVVSKEPIRIDAGFVLSYGGIEENCSFDAICRSEFDSLSDKACALLF